MSKILVTKLRSQGDGDVAMKPRPSFDRCPIRLDIDAVKLGKA